MYWDRTFIDGVIINSHFKLSISPFCRRCGEPDKYSGGSWHYCWGFHPLPHSRRRWLQVWNPVSHQEAAELSLCECSSSEDGVSCCKLMTIFVFSVKATKFQSSMESNSSFLVQNLTNPQDHI